MSAPAIDESFPHAWRAEVLPARPPILPARHYVYPRQAEEVERGALEVLVWPGIESSTSGAKAPTPLNRPFGTTKVVPFQSSDRSKASSADTASAQPFLATCALGFRDPAVPTGLWPSPNPDEICAVAGGYAYLIDTIAPEHFTMIPYRPVLRVVPAVEAGLLLFVGHRSILAWGRDGQAWESEKLSDEGVTITAIEGLVLRGSGWQLLTDKETAFELDLRSGKLTLPTSS